MSLYSIAGQNFNFSTKMACWVKKYRMASSIWLLRSDLLDRQSMNICGWNKIEKGLNFTALLLDKYFIFFNFPVRPIITRTWEDYMWGMGRHFKLSSDQTRSLRKSNSSIGSIMPLWYWKTSFETGHSGLFERWNFYLIDIIRTSFIGFDSFDTPYIKVRILHRYYMLKLLYLSYL